MQEVQEVQGGQEEGGGNLVEGAELETHEIQDGQRMKKLKNTPGLS